MKFILEDPRFLLNPLKWTAEKGRYRWHPDFPALRIDLKAISPDLSVRPLIVSPRNNQGKSDGSRYLIGVDLRLFPTEQEIPTGTISFDIYKGKIPHSFGGDRTFHFPHARFANIWLEMKISL